MNKPTRIVATLARGKEKVREGGCYSPGRAAAGKTNAEALPSTHKEAAIVVNFIVDVGGGLSI